MREMLELCGAFPRRKLAPGDVILTEGGQSYHLYVLVEGAMEVCRGEITIAFVTEPGSIFGEMSLLLRIPHTADVRAVAPSEVIVIDHPLTHLRANPALLLPIAELLAQRLRSSTTYLVDLKRQFGHRTDHLAMVDQVLEALHHQQGHAFATDEALPVEPSR